MKQEDLVLDKELADSTHTSGGRGSKGQRVDETSSAGEIQVRGESRNASRKRHGSCGPQTQTPLSSVTGSAPDLRHGDNKMSKTAVLRGIGSPEQLQILKGLLRSADPSACSAPQLGLLGPHQRE
jgi:hypothetical protein